VIGPSTASTTTIRCGEGRELRICRAPQRRPLDPLRNSAVELLLQPHRPLRPRPARPWPRPFFRRVTRRFPELNFAFLEAAWAGPARSTPTHRPLGDSGIRKGSRTRTPRGSIRRESSHWAEKYGKPAVWTRYAAARAWTTNGNGTAASKTSTTTPVQDHAQGRHPASCSCRASTSAARPTTPSTHGPSNRKANPLSARLNAIFSSDIGHMDVPDMTEVLPEAYELSSTNY